MLIANKQGILVLFFVIFPYISHACTSVLVGKKASDNGSVLIARTEDSPDSTHAKHMCSVEAKTYQPDDTITLSNGLVVQAPEKTFGFCAMPEWNHEEKANDGRYFDERGVNQAGVAMSATNSAYANSEAQAFDPFANLGIVEDNVVGLILGQAKSAQHAVQRLSHYIDEHGAGEAFGAQFADKNEAWYFEVGSRHLWIAVRIPDDKYMVAANGLRIHDVDLDSPDVMHAESLFEMVKQNRLLENPDKTCFNFAKAFGIIGDRYNTDREWHLINMFSGSLHPSTKQEQYPLFLTPDKKITVNDIAKALRTDYTGTELEGDTSVELRPVGVERNSEAHIIEMTPGMPAPLIATLWQTPSCVKYSPFTPLFCCALKDIPAPFTQGTDAYTANSAWWQYRRLGALSTPSVLNAQLHNHIRTFVTTQEKEFFGAHPAMQKKLKDSYAADHASTEKKAAEYSRTNLTATLEKTDSLFSAMITELALVHSESPKL